jgi:hypothetical protein
MTTCRTVAEVTEAAREDAAREDQPLTQPQADFWAALTAPHRKPPESADQPGEAAPEAA